MNRKTIRGMGLLATTIGSFSSAFADPGLLEIQSKTSLFNCNPSSPQCVPTESGSVSWGENAWGGPGRGTPPPPNPPSPWGHTGVLSNLLIGQQPTFRNALRAPGSSLSRSQIRSLSRGSSFPLANSTARVKFQRDARTGQYILDFGAIKQTATPLELKLTFKINEKKDHVFVGDFVFKIDASSPGVFSTELPPRDGKTTDSPLLVIKGVVRKPVNGNDKAQ